MNYQQPQAAGRRSPPRVDATSAVVPPGRVFPLHLHVFHPPPFARAATAARAGGLLQGKEGDPAAALALVRFPPLPTAVRSGSARRERAKGGCCRKSHPPCRTRLLTGGVRGGGGGQVKEGEQVGAQRPKGCRRLRPRYRCRRHGSRGGTSAGEPDAPGGVGVAGPKSQAAEWGGDPCPQHATPPRAACAGACADAQPAPFPASRRRRKRRRRHRWRRQRQRRPRRRRPRPLWACPPHAYPQHQQQLLGGRRRSGAGPRGRGRGTQACPRRSSPAGWPGARG